MKYDDYVVQKLSTIPPSGMDACIKDIGIFDFQEAIT